MSTAVPRFIIVDDVDTSIQYTGPWYESQDGNQGSAAVPSGPPYRGTLHGANSTASLALAFNGSQIIVLGTSDVLNTSGVLDPTWECFIDNIKIGASPLSTSGAPVNNQVFCNNDSLMDGPHVLTVNATPIHQTFWFDDIQYVPSASVPLDQAAIIINDTDPQLQYGAGWSSATTIIPGSIFTYEFFGVSLTWYGTVFPGNPVQASYSTDGQTPINFTFNGNNATLLDNFFNNQVFFQTAQLTAGPHTLTVVNEGSNLSPPSLLSLEYLIVQNGTLPSTTTSASSQAATSVTPTSSSSNGVGTTLSTGESSTPTGAIVGGVIGGLALVIFGLLGFLLLRRRHRGHAAQENDSLSIPTPFDYTLHPSNPTPSGGISYSQSPQTTQMGSTVTYGVKGQVHHASMSISSAHISRPVEPPSTSSGVAPYPTNSHPVPLQQTALVLANPSSSSPSSPVPSVHSPPLPSQTELKEAGALASLRPQRRGNPSVSASDTWSPNVVLHADSGLRMPSTTTASVDVPPVYTPD